MWSGCGDSCRIGVSSVVDECGLMECAEVFPPVLSEHLPRARDCLGHSRMLCDLRGPLPGPGGAWEKGSVEVLSWPNGVGTVSGQ